MESDSVLEEDFITMNTSYTEVGIVFFDPATESEDFFPCPKELKYLKLFDNAFLMKRMDWY